MPENITNHYKGLITALKKRLNAQEFLERNRQTDKAFTRKRCLPFVTVVLFLLNMVKRSLQDELDEFFNLENKAVVAEQIVTKSAFCQARKKLKAEAFIELNRVQVDYFYTHFPYQTWYDFRLLAVDGSTSQLPGIADIQAHFGLWGTVPLARVSQIFDVLNKVTIDASIGPKDLGERVYAAQHFAFLRPGDLVLLDRGYPAFWLFALIQDQGAQFCARMPKGVWNQVDRFIASGLREQVIHLHPSATARQECLDRNLPARSFKVRLIRIELDNGEVEVLVTSLLDAQRYPYAVFKELYHQRWPVEEDYKVLKLRTEVENWSGKSPLAIYQDFHAKVFASNLTAILAQPAQQEVVRQSQSKRYTYQVNFAHILSKMKDTIVFLLRGSFIEDILSSLWRTMTQVVEPIRPGRSFPRKKRRRLKQFSMNYKPLR